MGRAALQRRASHSSDPAKLSAEGRVTMTDLVSNLFHLLGSVPRKVSASMTCQCKRATAKPEFCRSLSGGRGRDSFLAAHGIPVLILNNLKCLSIFVASSGFFPGDGSER